MKKILMIFILSCVLAIGFFFLFRVKSTSHQSFTKHNVITLPVRVLENQSFSYTKSFIGYVNEFIRISDL